MAWQVFSLPMSEKFITALKPKYPEGFHDGIFFGGSFNLTNTGDIYFDMSHYSKGILYVNGHNLGRYWHKGPQQRLYCPASWLKKGKNEMVVFDLHKTDAVEVSGLPVLND